MNPQLSDIPCAILEWHRFFEKLTSAQLTPDFARLDAWRTFIGYRQPPFTHDDLRVVVLHLKQQIKHQKRNPGALKFRNLICQPDYFEEDLQEARAALRPRAPKTRQIVSNGTSRIVPNPNTSDTSAPVSAVLPRLIAEIRRAVQ